MSAPASAHRVVLHLVRHGESTWNVQRRLQGQTAHPALTPLGVRQAQDAAAVLASRVDDAAMLWSSDLVRARQTADVVGHRLGLPVRETAALREQALGSMEGRLTRDLVPEPTPPGRHISEIRWAGGESVADVHERIGAFLGGLLRADGAEADGPRAMEHVLVSHGDTIRIALAWLDGRGHRDVEWTPIPNGAVVTRRW